MKFILPTLVLGLALKTAAEDKLPWIENYEPAACAASRATNEQACGTKYFCSLQGNNHWIGNKYESQLACLNAHKPSPWYQGNNPSGCAFSHGTDEKSCGTAAFCRFHSTPNAPTKLYKNEEECLKGREPNPDVAMRKEVEENKGEDKGQDKGEGEECDDRMAELNTRFGQLEHRIAVLEDKVGR